MPINVGKYDEGDRVRQKDLGVGTVLSDLGQTVLVRFDKVIHECAKNDLELLPSIADKVTSELWDAPLKVVNRLQAESIISINESWGVFARSKIELLPYQLWVCKQVNQKWPTRWLVADDVGLGKTIEAGIILTPLIASGKIKHLLVLCPASLVTQWMQRLRDMFDIRLFPYSNTFDTDNTDFFNFPQIVASIQTLRKDSGGRLNRLLAAEPWDMVIVDESHHLNADEKSYTLAYNLVKALEENGRITSMLFFSGTPHRGNNFAFLAQLKLLRSDLFDPQADFFGQLGNLRQVMIRNNKYEVTDLEGKPIFQKHIVTTETYTYSKEEDEFYRLLTKFIIEGKAYASGLPVSEGTAVTLVLIAMQKLASSSVAAIRKAIEGRLARISKEGQHLEDLQGQKALFEELGSLTGNDLTEDLAQVEEEIVSAASNLRLMKNEEPALRGLLAAAQQVKEETKIKYILEAIDKKFNNRSVLFFTEYKATQSLMMSALMKRFGKSSVTFINGDEEAKDVLLPDGHVEKGMKQPREVASRLFNTGEVRFLVSTEAGGEGIDLQENCWSMVHIDLPWNPMRLHQRVGRLNRYGQKHRVEVLQMRNPDNIESLIWDKLNQKIEQISLAFRASMSEPDDLMELVLGMTSPTLFHNLFADAPKYEGERLSNFFNSATASFGSEDVLKVVQSIAGNVKRFDFGSSSNIMPRVDLPDLKPFFETSLILNGRRPQEDTAGLTFKTPAQWLISPVCRPSYSGIIFDRNIAKKGNVDKLFGVGHKIFDIAISEARKREDIVASLPMALLEAPILAFGIEDRVTSGGTGNHPRVIIGYRPANGNEPEEILKDWELLLFLNKLPLRKEAFREQNQPGVNKDSVIQLIKLGRSYISNNITKLTPEFRIPEIEFIGMLLPIKILSGKE